MLSTQGVLFWPTRLVQDRAASDGISVNDLIDALKKPGTTVSGHKPGQTVCYTSLPQGQNVMVVVEEYTPWIFKIVTYKITKP